MLEVIDMHKRFDAIHAVRGVSFRVGKGEVLGFLGPNGAGKSTTMRMICGFLPPTSGTARICGHDIIEAPVAAKQKLGYLPENAPAYAAMTVREFLTFMATIRGYGPANRSKAVEQAIERCHLENVLQQTIGTLSKGYRQRACFAQAILHDPPVLIMDEPTDGLDPNQKFMVRKMIREMAAEKAIIISTHILEEVDALCSHVIIIANGSIVADDTPGALRERSPNGRLDEIFRTLTIGQDEEKSHHG